MTTHVPGTRDTLTIGGRASTKISQMKVLYFEKRVTAYYSVASDMSTDTSASYIVPTGKQFRITSFLLVNGAATMGVIRLGKSDSAGAGPSGSGTTLTSAVFFGMGVEGNFTTGLGHGHVKTGIGEKVEYPFFGIIPANKYLCAAHLDGAALFNCFVYGYEESV